MNKNFQMIIVGDENSILKHKNFVPLSLAIGVIGGYLKDKNIKTKIHDINEKKIEKEITLDQLELISNIYEGKRVIEYLEGNNDLEMDRLAEIFLEDLTYDSNFYGISIGADFSLFQIHQGLIIAKYLKKRTNATIILGGNNVDYMYIYKEFYKDILTSAIKNIDYILRGPGEKTIYNILEGMYFEKSKIPGLLTITEGEIIANKEATPNIICPDWTNIDLGKYSIPLTDNQLENEKLLYSLPSTVSEVIFENRINDNSFRRAPFIPYIFNYNCNYKCAFCTQSAKERGNIIVGDVIRVVDHLEHLSKTYNSKYFYFLNNYFPSNKNFILEFKSELSKRNLEIYWSDCGRVNGMTKEKLQLLYECGCRKLIFGFESGDNNMLKFIDKKLDLDELSRVLKWCSEVGISADIEVIIGLPYEREKEYRNTYNYISKHKDVINNFWLNEFFLIPNSLLGMYPEKYGIEIKKNILNYNLLCSYNKKEFLGDRKAEMTSNSRLWGFNEINQNKKRRFREIQKHNAKKMKELEKLRNPEFAQLHRFYSMLNDIRN